MDDETFISAVIKLAYKYKPRRTDYKYAVWLELKHESDYYFLIRIEKKPEDLRIMGYYPNTMTMLFDSKNLDYNTALTLLGRLLL